MATTSTGWALSHLTLKVLDLDAQAEFYQRFGLDLQSRSAEEAVLGTGGRPLLELRRLPGGSPRPRRSAGLYHFALLLPGEAELGAFVVHSAAARLPFVGAGDHLVSQALYFQDPEDNGIEVYADRPRESWTWDGGRLLMDTLPGDLDRLARLAGGSPWHGLPGGTVLGHMHLNVADLDRSQAHYEAMGMQVVAALPSARFLSWEGYHHHLGINLWRGPGVGPVLPEVAGLESFRVNRPGIHASGEDTDGIGVLAGAVTGGRARL